MAVVDIEMSTTTDDKKADDKKKSKEEESAPAPAPVPPPTPVAIIKTNIALIERAVTTLEPRFTHRVLRNLAGLRKRIDDKVLRDAIKDVYGNGMLYFLL